MSDGFVPFVCGFITATILLFLIGCAALDTERRAVAPACVALRSDPIIQQSGSTLGLVNVVCAALGQK